MHEQVSALQAATVYLILQAHSPENTTKNGTGSLMSNIMVSLARRVLPAISTDPGPCRAFWLR